MDYRKIDAALAAALDEVEDQEKRNLLVFIHGNRPLGVAEIASILGAQDLDPAGKKVITLTLSAREIADLSIKDWVKSIKLSRRLSLLDDD